MEIFKGNQKPKTEESVFFENFEFKKRNFKEFVELYKKPVYSFLFYMLGDEDRAYTLSHKIFVRAYYKLPKITDPNKIKLWIFKKLLHYSNRYYNKFPLSELESEVTDEEYYDLEGDGAKISYERFNLKQDEEALARKDCIIQVLNKLKYEFRVIYILKDLLAFDVSFISEILQMTQGTVLSRLAKARYEVGIISSDVVIERREKL